MTVQIEKTWDTALARELQKPYFRQLGTRVQKAYQNSTAYPAYIDIFAALSHCPLPTVKVVILGQDPYHGPGQAHGLAFSVPNGIDIPPSLRNIYKEIVSDIGVSTPDSGNLIRWADQGVLLLNTTLTVEAGKPASHSSWGWGTFTDRVIQTISQEREHVVFLLWGAHALSKRPLIDEQKHLVVTAPHPSPLSAYRGFFGCKHFSQTNNYLMTQRETPIIW